MLHERHQRLAQTASGLSHRIRRGAAARVSSCRLWLALHPRRKLISARLLFFVGGEDRGDQRLNILHSERSRDHARDIFERQRASQRLSVERCSADNARDLLVNVVLQDRAASRSLRRRSL